MVMKIAAVTEDGIRMSAHFGMAPQYRVFTVEGNKIIADELRNKPHHSHHPNHGHDHLHEHHQHNHEDMFAPIRDCSVLLAGGMGAPAHQKALAANLQVFLTGGDILQAVQAYLQGMLVNDPRRIHTHNHK